MHWLQKKKKKTKVDGSLESCKTQSVANEYTQQPNLDFVDTYSPMENFTYIKIIISIVVRMNLKFYELDVKIIFYMANEKIISL